VNLNHYVYKPSRENLVTMTRKCKIQLEYIVNCSPKVLFNRLSTPTDFGEEDEKDEIISLWNNHIFLLRQVTGSTPA